MDSSSTNAIADGWWSPVVNISVSNIPAYVILLIMCMNSA